jgi:hypothetical protein
VPLSPRDVRRRESGGSADFDKEEQHALVALISLIGGAAASIIKTEQQGLAA